MRAAYSPAIDASASVVRCDYCNACAQLVTGREIYPHRDDLAQKLFYRCVPCDAWVGCHDGTVLPLGRLANAELRAAKQQVHTLFDPIWRARWHRKRREDPKYRKHMARGGRYRLLAQLMGIPQAECHIGMFDLDRCHLAIQALRTGVLQRDAERP